MGCDIHFYVEKKQADGTWKAQGTFEKDEDESGWIHQSSGCLYSGRNYNLFSILADVRNGRGFAGIKTGEGFNPISEPRGVPDDASSDYKALVEQWDGDGHSHSPHPAPAARLRLDSGHHLPGVVQHGRIPALGCTRA